ncbi:MAG: carboxypeptidase regulatory-like domain-containing protein [Clostridiales bacterium]|nr:carboxypeptidase regulatory-like domain-containing protein [Clostridiales bacterium]
MATESFDEMINRYRNESYEYMRRSKPVSVQPETAVPMSAPQEQPPSMKEPEKTIKTMDPMQRFLMENPEEGRLKIQASTAQGAVPIAGASVQVSREIGGKPHVFYNVVTDEDGIADGMTLPAPPKILSETPQDCEKSWATYDIEVSHPNFPTQKFKNIPIFDGVETIQPVNFLPAQEPMQPEQEDS